MNLADLDTSFLVPCRHCAELMQEGVRVCPSCGKDQFAAAGEAQRASGRQVRTRATKAKIDSEIDLAGPGTSRQKEPLGGGGPEHWARKSVISTRSVIGIAAALVVVLLGAVVHDHFLVDRQGESEVDEVRKLRANVEQVKSALSRGDLGTAKRLLNVVDADHANAPGVQELRQEFDRRMQEQATGQEKVAEQEQPAKQEQLGDTAPKASRALGLNEPPAAPAQAPSPAAMPVVAIPAPEIGVADPKEKECNEALAALALCAGR